MVKGKNFLRPSFLNVATVQITFDFSTVIIFFHCYFCPLSFYIFNCHSIFSLPFYAPIFAYVLLIIFLSVITCPVHVHVLSMSGPVHVLSISSCPLYILQTVNIIIYPFSVVLFVTSANHQISHVFEFF